jgi:formyl-CoA transferase/CoA:oxalate CoA-transferase
MLDNQVAWLTYQAGTFFGTGTPPPRLGAAHPNLVPYQAFQCSDGKFVNVAVGNERFWERFCNAINRMDLMENPIYKTNQDRVKNRSGLVSLLQQEFANKKASEWVEVLEESGVPSGAINDLSDVFSDPQVVHRGMILEMDHPTAGRIKQTGLPIKFSGTPGSIDIPPPLLGQHNEEILTELGFAPEEIRDLQREQII